VISGYLLREARRRAGLSQATLAARAGKPTSVIGRWERGEVKPSLETLLEVIRASGLDLRFRVTDFDDSQDALILAAFRMSPEQRLEQLETFADFVGQARKNAGLTG
jgi:transcriptional regulator with XRE-family HTH domain